MQYLIVDGYLNGTGIRDKITRLFESFGIGYKCYTIKKN